MILLYSNDSKNETNVLPVPQGIDKIFLLCKIISEKRVLIYQIFDFQIELPDINKNNIKLYIKKFIKDINLIFYVLGQF